MIAPTRQRQPQQQQQPQSAFQAQYGLSHCWVRVSVDVLRGGTVVAARGPLLPPPPPSPPQLIVHTTRPLQPQPTITKQCPGKPNI